MKKNVQSNIDPKSDRRYKCKKCKKLFAREEYIQDDNVCHGCFEKDFVLEEPNGKS